jgi:hypothetical protein
LYSNHGGPMSLRGPSLTNAGMGGSAGTES